MVLVLFLQLLITLAEVAALAVLVDIFSLAFSAHYAKLSGYANRKKPDMAGVDEVNYPKVAILLPVYNEGNIVAGVVKHCCAFDWPKDKLFIRVLDDSSDETSRKIADDEVTKWKARGINIECIRRNDRSGYKSGNLQCGYKALEGSNIEYMAIFDADFEPTPDFLKTTIPYMVERTDIGFVQTRWTYTNPNQNTLTKYQERYLNFAMRGEQFALFLTDKFFIFNGAGGVWRTKCIQSCGGFSAKTTVEDKELSLKSYLLGWRGVYLEDTLCRTELPTTMDAFYTQQHRWKAGTSSFVRISFPSILKSKTLSLRQKFDTAVRYHIILRTLHDTNSGFIATYILLPLSIIFNNAGVVVPMWLWLLQPLAFATIKMTFTEGSSILDTPFWVIFSNAWGPVRLRANVIGLLGLPEADSWVVTAKGEAASRSWFKPRIACSLMLKTSLFMITVGVYGLCYKIQSMASCWVLINGLLQLAVALGFVC